MAELQKEAHIKNCSNKKGKKLLIKTFLQGIHKSKHYTEANELFNGKVGCIPKHYQNTNKRNAFYKCG